MNDDAALADIESAMHNHNFSKILQIEGLHTSNNAATEFFKTTSQKKKRRPLYCIESVMSLQGVS